MYSDISLPFLSVNQLWKILKVVDTRINILKVIGSDTFITGDIASLDLESASFDAIVSFYTLFHLPRDEHRPLLERIARWLRPGGYILMTFAETAQPGYTERDFCGATMFWSNFELDWYVSALESLDFEILRHGVIGNEERHPVVLARAAAD